MRAFIFLFIGLLLAFYADGQIPLKTNAIVVKEVSFAEACSKILDKGYEIEKKDNDLMTAKTVSREYVRFWNAEYTISIRVKDSTLHIIGAVTAPPKTGGLFDNRRLEQDRGAKNLFTVGFSYLDEYARTFGKPIEYIRE